MCGFKDSHKKSALSDLRFLVVEEEHILMYKFGSRHLG